MKIQEFVLFQQNEDRSDVNETEKSFGKFIITSSDTPELFDFLPKVFDQMAFFVFPPVAFALNSIGFPAGDVGNCAKRFQPIYKLLTVVSFVRVDDAAI